MGKPSAASIVALLLLLSAAGCSEQALQWLWTQHQGHHGDAGVSCPAGATLVGEECEWTYAALAAGSNHTCGIRAETGAVVCWGQSFGVTDWPRDVAFTQVSTGSFLSCGILRDSGAIRCWGGTAPSSLPSTGSYRQVSVSRGSFFGDFVCAIRRDDDNVECWTGDRAPAGFAAPSGVAFSAINASDSYACGIRRDDSQVQCWGADDISVPDGELCSLSQGVSSIIGMCGLRCDGQAVCFGTSLSDQAAPSSERFTELELGLEQVCGIRAADSSIGCWRYSQPVAAPADTDLEKLAVGGDVTGASINVDVEAPFPKHACALRKGDGRVVCWGDDAAGQVSGAPSFTRFTELALRAHRSNGTMDWPIDTVCGLRERDQLAQCWGGDGFDLPLDEPLDALASTSCAIRAADGRSTCNAASAPDVALSELDETNGGVCGIRADDHSALCWTGGINSPQAIPVHGLTVGNRHACAIRDEDHYAMCWGNDLGGPISDMPANVAFRQLQAEEQTDPLYNYIADAQTCGVRETDGLVACWGTRDALIVAARPRGPLWKLSQSGDCGLSLDAHEAVCANGMGGDAAVLPGVKLEALETGSNFKCGIRASDGLLTCWGGVLWNPL